MDSCPQDASVTIPLSPQRDQYWRCLFKKYDKDNDERISYEELREILNSNEEVDEIPEEVVRKIMDMSDHNGSGDLDYNEFVDMITHPELESLFGYFARYVDTIVPPRTSVEDDVNWAEFRMMSATYYSGPIRKKITYMSRYKCWPPAFSMLVISLAELVLYCYDVVVAEGIEGPIATTLKYDPHLRHEAWRYLTYMLMHTRDEHLIFNLLVQLFLGIPLEMVHSWWRVSMVYMAGVASGSIATSLTESRPLMGASGGVYALLTAHLANLIMNRTQIKNSAIKLILFTAVPVVNVGIQLYQRYGVGGANNVGVMTHLAGCIAGLLVGLGVIRNLRKRTRERRLWLASVVLYTALMVAGILANIFWTSHFPPYSKKH